MASHSQQLLEFSEGVLANMTDAVLALTYAMAAYATLPRKDYSRVTYTVENTLQQFNYQTIKRAFSHLLHQGLIEKSSAKELPYITKKGADKLALLLPRYKSHRPWNKKLYLITYDLPNTRTPERTRLSRLFRRLNFGLLQKSAWITPYHPKTQLESLIEAKNLQSLIAVSVIDTSVGIGTTNLSQLMHQLYPLETVNLRYQQFIHQAQAKNAHPAQLVFSFCNIVKSDPQLPFELLPDKWYGQQAYQKFCLHTGLT